MKKLILITILFVSISNYLFAQWTTSGTNIYTNNTGSVVVGATTPSTVNASAALFPSVTSKFNVVTGTGPATYTDLVTLYHPGVNIDAVQRQMGLVLKLSSESSVIESDKMGGMILESSNGAANYPSFSLVTANTRRLTIDFSGNIGINTTDTKGYKFAVNGNAIATAITVKQNASWPDYVFKKDYTLPALSEVKVYIDQNLHLPEIPSAQEIAKDGQNLGEMNRLLLKKVEELTLYLIEKDAQDKQKDKQLDELQKRVAQLEKNGLK
jgi:hypothetical protein